MGHLEVGFTDKDLVALYRQVAAAPKGVSVTTLDRPLPTVDYTRHRQGPLSSGPDGVLQSHELFEAIATQPKLHDAYLRFANEPLPWIPSSNPVNKALLRKFDETVREWRKANSEKDPHGPALAQEILRWVLNPEPEGMGMKAEILGPEWNFDRAVQNKKGNCTELTFLLMSLYERAGYKVHAEWVGVDMYGESVIHVAAGVDIKGTNYLVDAVYGEGKGIWNPPHRSHTPITRRQLLGIYWHNRGLYEDQHGDPKLALEFYKRAEAIDAFNPYIYLNRGQLFLKDRQLPADEVLKKAEAEFRRALKLDPDFPPALLELGILFDRKKDFHQALVHIRKSLKGDPQNLKARIFLLQALGGLGRFPEAQKELQALKNSLPANPPSRQLQQVQRVASWLACRENGKCP